MRKLIPLLIMVILMLSGLGSAELIHTNSLAHKEEIGTNDGTEYWALLIGNNEYINKPSACIPGADKAAEALYNTLLVTNHWQKDHIKLLTGKNASSLNIIKGFRWLDRMDDEDDMCLVFMAIRSGHFQKDLYPKEEEPDGMDDMIRPYSYYRFMDKAGGIHHIPYFTWFIDDQISEWIGKLESKGVCLIMDGTSSCGGFNDPFLDTCEDSSIRSNKMTTTNGLLLASCEETTDWGENDYSLISVFAHMLINGLQGYADTNNDQMISAEEAFEYACPTTKYYQEGEFKEYVNPVIFDKYSGDFILTEKQYPPNELDLNGPISGHTKTKYTFSFSSVDPEGEDIRYHIDWGDGTEEWTDYYPSEEKVILTYSWESCGSYNIKFNAEDIHGASSDIDLPPVSHERYVISISDEDYLDQRQVNIYKGQCFKKVTIETTDYNTIWYAQSFIPDKETLTKIDLEVWISEISSENPGPLHLHIRSDLNGPDLTDIIVMPYQLNDPLNELFPSNFKWTTFDFPDIKVNPGETYYIILGFDDAGSIGGWTYAGIGYTDDPDYIDDPYVNGHAFISENYGFTWVKYPLIYDFGFITYGI